jgi:tripartite-type tricarboxylate transporter receptor subunit TctC
MIITRRVAIAALVLAGLSVAVPAVGQELPNGPVTIIVPFPAGGLGDLAARRLSPIVSDRLKRQIVVDYKPGGGGTIGANNVKNAQPDGATLLIANVSIMAINPSLMTKVPYDPVQDFHPISMLMSSSHILLVPSASPIKSFADLIAVAKAKQASLSFASAGIGGGGHLLGEMLKQATGGDLVHVPYKGAALAMQDVLGGRIDIYFESVALAMPHVASGGVRALAVTSKQRLAGYPDIPTTAELGYPNLTADAWFALFAPAAVPKPVADRLNVEFVRALHDPDTAKAFTEQGLEVLPGTPDQLADTLSADLQRYGKLIREIGAKLD